DELFAYLSEKKLKKGSFYRANRRDVPIEIMKKETFEERISFAKNNIINTLGKNINHMFIPPRIPEWIFGFQYTTKFLNIFFKKIAYVLHPNINIRLFKLDTEACGDFTLMHIDDWKLIEGYPELDLYSIHIDSMAIIS